MLYGFWNVLALLSGLGTLGAAVYAHGQLGAVTSASGAPVPVGRAVPVFAALAFVGIWLGDPARGLGLRPALALLLGVAAALGCARFAGGLAGRPQAPRLAARAGVVQGLWIAGLGLLGLGALAIVFRADGAASLLAFSLGAGAVACLGHAGSGGLRLGTHRLAAFSAAIAATAVVGLQSAPPGDGRAMLILYPLVIAGLGTAASFAMYWRAKGSTDADFGNALLAAQLQATLLLVGCSALVTLAMQPSPTGVGVHHGHWSIWSALVVGQFAGLTLDRVTGTDGPDQPTSGWLPVLLLAIAAWVCNQLGGSYGIAIAAVGMLGTMSLAATTGRSSGTLGKGLATAAATFTCLALAAVYAGETRRLVGDLPLQLDNAEVGMGLLVGAMLPMLLGTSLPAAGIAALLAPVATGMVFGKAAAGGLLLGAMAAGIPSALFARRDDATRAPVPTATLITLIATTAAVALSCFR